MKTHKGKILKLRKRNADVAGVIVGELDIRSVPFVVVAYGLSVEELKAWASVSEWPLEIFPPGVRICKLPLESVRKQLV